MSKAHVPNVPYEPVVSGHLNNARPTADGPRLTLSKLQQMLPEDVRGVLTDAETKGRWLVGNHRAAWQDQMIIGLCAMIAEASAKNANLFVRKNTDET